MLTLPSQCLQVCSGIDEQFEIGTDQEPKSSDGTLAKATEELESVKMSTQAHGVLI